MEIAVPIKDRLCRAALNMRSNACCRCTPRWWKKHRWTTTPWYPSPPPETLFPLRHVRIQCTKSKLSRDLSNPFAWQILESRWFSLVTKSMRTKRNSHFTTHEKNTIEIYPRSHLSNYYVHEKIRRFSLLGTSTTAFHTHTPTHTHTHAHTHILYSIPNYTCHSNGISCKK